MTKASLVVMRTVVVMGVSGCGKSTLAAALAQRLGWSLVEGDELHPPENVRKMTAGIPLTDQDRLPFIRKVAEALAAHPQGSVAACSALRRTHRNLIREQVGQALFVLPRLPKPELIRRLNHRRGHFMPLTLLDSQLATLEAPGSDECAVELDGLLPLSEQLTVICSELTDIKSCQNGSERTAEHRD